MGIVERDGRSDGGDKGDVRGGGEKIGFVVIIAIMIVGFNGGGGEEREEIRGDGRKNAKGGIEDEGRGEKEIGDGGSN